MAIKEVFYTLDEFDTEIPADSVEWCPAESFQDLLACGTYKLIENKEDANDEKCKRTGRIYLLRVADGGKLRVLQQIDTSGVLDMKWIYVTDSANNRILLAVANSNGHLQIYELKKKESEAKLQLIAEERICDDNEDVMALSLDWSIEGCSSYLNPHIAVSDSQGKISRFTWHETNNLIKDFTVRAHEFQAWIVAFDYCNVNIFYSGGDDNKFLTFDTRTGSTPVSCNSEHTSGVTSIHGNIVKPFMLATGSYDEILRLWDKRDLKRPMSETNLKGGIWRLKWDPFTRQYLFAACMYEGFKIVDCSYDTSIIGHYNKHCGISYGCDWSFLKKEDVSRLRLPVGETLVSTCSYQDCALKLSAVNFKIYEPDS
ncbi:diphthine methyltransferase [Polyergus mexicanus]|uniref:diphthine methyltransferase n=1 Tax=Polyergus mexicanus TaxID=615972 RepID=UPI0038B571BB